MASSEPLLEPSTFRRQASFDFDGDALRRVVGGCYRYVIGAVLVIGALSLRVIEPASVAVVVTLGRVSEDTLASGMHFVHPLAWTTPFTLKTVLLEQANHVPTKEGLTVELDVAVVLVLAPAEQLADGGAVH